MGKLYVVRIKRCDDGGEYWIHQSVNATNPDMAVELSRQGKWHAAISNRIVTGYSRPLPNDRKIEEVWEFRVDVPSGVRSLPQPRLASLAGANKVRTYERTGTNPQIVSNEITSHKWWVIAAPERRRNARIGLDVPAEEYEKRSLSNPEHFVYEYRLVRASTLSKALEFAGLHGVLCTDGVVGVHRRYRDPDTRGAGSSTLKPTGVHPWLIYGVPDADTGASNFPTSDLDALVPLAKISDDSHVLVPVSPFTAPLTATPAQETKVPMTDSSSKQRWVVAAPEAQGGKIAYEYRLVPADSAEEALEITGLRTQRVDFGSALVRYYPASGAPSNNNNWTVEPSLQTPWFVYKANTNTSDLAFAEKPAKLHHTHRHKFVGACTKRGAPLMAERVLAERVSVCRAPRTVWFVREPNSFGGNADGRLEYILNVVEADNEQDALAVASNLTDRWGEFYGSTGDLQLAVLNLRPDGPPWARCSQKDRSHPDWKAVQLPTGTDLPSTEEELRALALGLLGPSPGDKKFWVVAEQRRIEGFDAHEVWCLNFMEAPSAEDACKAVNSNVRPGLQRHACTPLAISYGSAVENGVRVAIPLTKAEADAFFNASDMTEKAELFASYTTRPEFVAAGVHKERKPWFARATSATQSSYTPRYWVVAEEREVILDDREHHIWCFNLMEASSAERACELVNTEPTDGSIARNHGYVSLTDYFGGELLHGKRLAVEVPSHWYRDWRTKPRDERRALLSEFVARPEFVAFGVTAMAVPFIPATASDSNTQEPTTMSKLTESLKSFADQTSDDATQGAKIAAGIKATRFLQRIITTRVVPQLPSFMEGYATEAVNSVYGGAVVSFLGGVALPHITTRFLDDKPQEFVKQTAKTMREQAFAGVFVELADLVGDELAEFFTREQRAAEREARRAEQARSERTGVRAEDLFEAAEKPREVESGEHTNAFGTGFTAKTNGVSHSS